MSWQCKYCDYETTEGPENVTKMGQCPKCGRFFALERFDPLEPVMVIHCDKCGTDHEYDITKLEVTPQGYICACGSPQLTRRLKSADGSYYPPLEVRVKYLVRPLRFKPVRWVRLLLVWLRPICWIRGHRRLLVVGSGKRGCICSRCYKPLKGEP